MEVRPIDGNILRKWCEKIIDQACHPATVQIGEVFLDKVRSMPTLTPPNEPLTLEQLREMNGEPVWVTSARERGNIPSRWVLFAGVSKSKRNSDVFVFATTGGIGQGYEAVNYGKTWNAYRRPPEG